MENKHFWKSNIVLYAVLYTSKSTSMITFIYYICQKRNCRRSKKKQYLFLLCALF